MARDLPASPMSRSHVWRPALAASRRWRSKKAQEMSRKQKARNEWMDRQRKLKRMKGLHPAAKWKRVLSASDYWFSDINLATDEFLIHKLHRGGGWISLRTLLTFPKFQHWTDAQLLLDAYMSTAGAIRYEVEHHEEPGRARVRRRGLEPSKIERYRLAIESDGYSDNDGEWE